MLHCREISRLVSESMERPFTFRERLQVGMHLAMCRLCYGFSRQIRLLRTAARREIPPADPSMQATLSDDARRRIKAALRQQDT